MPTYYCIKCHAKHEMKNGGDRQANQGICSICGNKGFRVEKSQGRGAANNLYTGCLPIVLRGGGG
jgi:hypothetical protein